MTDRPQMGKPDETVSVSNQQIAGQTPGRLQDDRPLIDEVREALIWSDDHAFAGWCPVADDPGLRDPLCYTCRLLARLDGMVIVSAGEVERLREAGWALYHNIVDENGRKYAANDSVLRAFRAALGEEAGRG